MSKHALSDPAHPIWGFAKFVILIGVLTALLWGEATHFDETELRVISQFAALWAGGAGAGWGIKRIVQRSKER